MKIELDAGTNPPLFRFSNEDDEPVSLTEIRITEVGQTEPSWLLVYRDEWLDGAVTLNIITKQESERAGVPITRNFGNGLPGPAVDPGVLVGELRYGKVPHGLEQNGSLYELKPNHLYHLVATGTTVGELEFFG